MAAKPVVLATRKLPPAVEDRLCRDYDATLNPDDSLYTPEAMLSAAAGAEALFILPSERLTADIIARLPAGVRAVATFSVGYEHIDLAAAKDRGLIVTNTPDVLSDATAETAMLCLLGAARRGGEGEALVRTREWKDWSPNFMVGTQVTGKRLGVVGMGRVGQVVARRARCFDMEIHYHNRSRLDSALEAGATLHPDLERKCGV